MDVDAVAGSEGDDLCRCLIRCDGLVSLFSCIQEGSMPHALCRAGVGSVTGPPAPAPMTEIH